MKKIDVIFDIATGKTTIIERDETASETKERLDHSKELATAQAKAEVKATARQVILDRLGLTADEAQLLLGGN